MYKFFISLSIILLMSFASYAQERNQYSFIQGAYVTNTAEDVKDDVGSVYYSDPDDQATLLGIGFGSVLEEVQGNYRLNAEFEASYIFGADIKVLSAGAFLKPTTKAIFANLGYDKYIIDKTFVKLSGGIGFSRTDVDTKYDDGSTTFTKFCYLKIY